MKTITLDCAGLENAQALHEALAEALQFPEWYGKNLDALYDCLAAIHEETQLTVLRLPAFASGFRVVLQDAENDNDCLIVTFE